MFTKGIICVSSFRVISFVSWFDQPSAFRGGLRGSEGAAMLRGMKDTTPKAVPGLCPAEASTDSRDVSGEYWRWCPRCGHELHNEKCKLRCPRCHYFMSCSDFD
jgi:hypothetical protein